jgi:cell division protein FtsI/penicillin-binding protein 2
VDYSVGLTTLGGSFPEPESEVEHAAAAIGQARVTASPLHMATVAAAALDGTWRAPFLVRDGAEHPTRPLDPVAHSRLAELMRLVVSEGTGTAARVPGLDLLGKTGTAEFGSGSPPPTHAWFIAGGRGLGVAVVLEGGGVGGRDAAPIAARFFRALG